MPLLATYQSWLHRRYRFESRADQIHHVTCDDDVRLSLKRFLPRLGHRSHRLPVICVPGLGADSHNYDAPGEFGLAPALAAQGFDTWVIDLRGTGRSRVPRARWSAIRFDDFIELDLPAAIAHIRQQTGMDELLWLGHSMGGMALYASLGAPWAQSIRAGVTLGSPVGFPQRWDCVPVLRHLHPLADHLPGLHVRGPLRLLAPLCLSPQDRASESWAVRENVDVGLCRQLLYAAVQDVPRGVALQFRDWIHHDAFRSADQRRDYRARMAGAQLPILVVCGPKDRLGVPDSVSRARALLPNHEWQMLSQASGFSADYGHIDMVFGRQAPREVFPLLFDFFERHGHHRGRMGPRLRAVR